MTSDDNSQGSPSSVVDRAGAVASSLCAVHCLLAAFVPASIAALGLGSFLGQGVEWGFVAVSILFAALALVVGWRRHRSRTVAALLVLGIGGLLLSRGLEMGGEDHGAHHAHEEHGEAHAGPWHAVGTAVGVGAGLLLVVGHAFNHRASSRHAHCGDECEAQAAQQPS